MSTVKGGKIRRSLSRWASGEDHEAKELQRGFVAGDPAATSEAVDAFLAAVQNGHREQAMEVLRAEPALESRSIHAAAVLGLDSEVRSLIAADPELQGLPISGIGGAHTWQDCAEFMLLGSSTVQVCTAIMHHGFDKVVLVNGHGGNLAARRLSAVGGLESLVSRTWPGDGSSRRA